MPLMPQKPLPPSGLPRIDALAFIEAEERKLDSEEAKLNFLKAQGVASFSDAVRRIGIAWERSELAFRRKRAAAERDWEDSQREAKP